MNNSPFFLTSSGASNEEITYPILLYQSLPFVVQAFVRGIADPAAWTCLIPFGSPFLTARPCSLPIPLEIRSFWGSSCKKQADNLLLRKPI